MCYLYLTDHNAKVGIDGGVITVKVGDGHCETIPQETVEGICIYGNAGITTQAVHHFMQQGITIGYFSQQGTYLGKAETAHSENAARLRSQIHLSEDERFALSVAKKIVGSKIKQQIAVLKQIDENLDAIGNLEHYLKIVRFVKGVPALMGVEGSASREYFDAWKNIFPDEWAFSGRNRRPSKDPINAMLNFGYSLLYKEVLGAITTGGLCAYVGFLHSDRIGHATLASDLMEEWRPIIVDSVVLDLIQTGKIQMEHFQYEGKECRMTPDGIKLFLAAIERKMHETSTYLSGIKKELSFREAIWHQVRNMCSLIDNKRVSEYVTVCA